MSRKVSKFLALVLRHKPEVLGIELDEQGWTDVDVLLEQMQAQGKDIDRAGLEIIVAEDSKGRYALEGNRIRANQGHSVKHVMAVDSTPREPPEVLYHGTHAKAWTAIEQEGLKAMKRHHVHLSVDWDTAWDVGARRRRHETVMLEIDAARMRTDGYVFLVSDNGVWHVDEVPPRYLRQISR